MTRRSKPLPPHAPYIALLEDAKLYSPNLVILNGEQQGLTDPNTGADEQANNRLYLRRILIQEMVNHRFPKKGDGYLPNFPSVRGWLGRRWKLLFDRHQLKKLRKELCA